MLNWNVLTVRLVASLFLVGGVGSAGAQIAAGPPAVREMTDSNGVDLLTGKMVGVYEGPSIGPAGASLSVVRQVRGGGVWDSYLGAVILEAGGASVVVDGVTDRFTGSGTTFASAESTGATLTVSGGTWTYTSRLGIVATFAQPTFDYAHPTNAVALVSAIVYPNGERTTFEYTIENICEVVNGQTCLVMKTTVRVTSVTSNRGYKISLAYPPGHTPGSGVTAVDFFFVPNQITLTNLGTGAVVGSLSMNYWFFQIDTYWMELTDALGRVTKFYIQDGQGVVDIYRPGIATPYIYVIYHPDGKVGAVYIGGVWTATYAYSESGSTRTTTVTSAAGGQRVVTSDFLTGRVLSDRNELNHTTTYAYDAQGRLSRVTAPEGNFVEYTRDARGNITQTLLRAKPGSGLADITTTANFDATCANAKTCNQPNWTRDARGSQTDYTYDATHGGVLTVTQPAPTAGAVRPQVRYSYTALEAWYLNTSGVLAASGQPIYLLTGTSTCRTLSSCVGSADESKTVIGYGSSGVANNRWPVTTTSSDGSGALVLPVTSGYDTTGNVLTVDGPIFGTADTVRTRYDALRRHVGSVAPDPDGAGGRIPVAKRHTYNTAGDLITVEKGTVTSQSDADWSTFAPFEVVGLERDSSGRLIKSTLSAGATTYAVEQTSYDAVGRPVCVATRMNPAVFASLPSSACTLGAVGSYGPDRIARRTYNAAGRVTKVTTGYGTPNPIDAVTATYTPNGRTATSSDGRNYLSTFEYDGFDRPFKTRFPSPSTPGTSSTTDYEQTTYDLPSNVVYTRQRNGQTITLWLDNLNRLVLKDLPVGSSEDVYLSYDNQGRALSARFASPTGAGVVSTYDGLGRLQTRTTFGRMLSYLYDLSGRRTRVTHPDGFYAQYWYNSAGELTDVSDPFGGSIATPTYDVLGRRSVISRANGTSTSFGFDAVSRLSTLTQNLAGTTYDGTATFTPIPSSQIGTRTQTNDATYSWTTAVSPLSMIHNGLNQLTQLGSTGVTHDTLGNLATGESTFTYGYDIENRLRSAVAGGTTISLAYDPLGVLSQVTTSAGATTNFLYDGLDLVAEYSSAGTVVRRYVHGGGIDEPLVWYEGSGTTDRRFLHADERGSIVAISNNSGTGTTSFKYSPDGESANPASSRFGYTGQVWLAEVGLYYYKSRMYSSKVGRFLQTDAIGYAGGLNLYAYVGGDPINGIDPYGFNPVDPNAPDCDGLTEVCVSPPRPPFRDTFERDLFFMDAIEVLNDAFAINEYPVLPPAEQRLRCTSGVPSSDPAAKNQGVFVGDEYGNAVFSYDLPVDAPTRTWGGNYTSSVTGTSTATGAAVGGASGIIAGGKVGVAIGVAEAASLDLFFGTIAISHATTSGMVLGGISGSIAGAIAGAAFGLAADLRMQSDLVEHCEPVN